MELKLVRSFSCDGWIFSNSFFFVQNSTFSFHFYRHEQNFSLLKLCIFASEKPKKLILLPISLQCSVFSLYLNMHMTCEHTWEMLTTPQFFWGIKICWKCDPEFICMHLTGHKSYHRVDGQSNKFPPKLKNLQGFRLQIFFVHCSPLRKKTKNQNQT